MLHPYYYHDFTLKSIGKFLNHDDTIPEADLQEYVELTNDAWEFRNNPRGFRYSLKKTVNTILLKNNSKTPVQYIDGRIPNREETLFQNRYNSGAFEPTPADDLVPGSNTDMKKNGTTLADGYDKKNTSFHDKRRAHYVQF